MATTKSTLSPAEKKAKRAAEKVAAFKRLATARVTRAITALENVGGLSNRNSYTYDEGQLSKIFTALDASVTQLKQRFAASKSGAPAGFTL